MEPMKIEKNILSQGYRLKISNFVLELTINLVPKLSLSNLAYKP